MNLEQEITKAVGALKLSKIAESVIRKRVLIQPDDKPSRRFYRTVVKLPWDGATEAARQLAAHLADMFDYENGTLSYCNSVRELATVTGRSTSTTRDALALLKSKGFITHETIQGKRTVIAIGPSIMDLKLGQAHTEHLSKSYLNIVNNLMATVVPVDYSGVVPVDYGHPSHPPHHQTSHQQAGLAGSPDVVSAPTTEVPLASCPNLTSPAYTTLYNLEPARHVEATNGKSAYTSQGSEEPPRPPVVDTTNIPVESASTTSWGYGTEILGLNGKTSKWVDRLAALDGGVTVGRDPAWAAVNRTVAEQRVRFKDHPECADIAAFVTREAIKQMEAKRASGELTTKRPAQALPRWASRIDPDEVADRANAKAAARAELEERATKARRKITMFGGNSLSREEEKAIWQWDKLIDEERAAKGLGPRIRF